MAARKTTRSNSTTQLNRPKPDTKYHAHPHHLETELFDTLRQFNQAFGTALCALERIDTRFTGPNGGRKARVGLRNSVRGLVRAYGIRIGQLRAQVNRDLFRVLAGPEDRSAARLSRLQQSRA